MLALADSPSPASDYIPGLTRSDEWHREQEAEERAWLDEYAHLAHRIARMRLLCG